MESDLLSPCHETVGKRPITLKPVKMEVFVCLNKVAVIQKKKIYCVFVKCLALNLQFYADVLIFRSFVVVYRGKIAVQILMTVCVLFKNDT